MADDDGNIVDFKSSAPSARLKSFDRSAKHTSCRHKQIEVWHREPIIECQNCGVVVDPYQWIRDRCRDHDQMMNSLEYQKQALQGEIEELKKMRRVLRREYRDERERRDTERAVAVLPPQSRY